MKIKLPRKRKKAYLKTHEHLDYMSQQIVNEVLYEDKPIRSNTRFVDFEIVKNRIKITKYW